MPILKFLTKHMLGSPILHVNAFIFITYRVIEIIYDSLVRLAQSVGQLYYICKRSGLNKCDNYI
jgi:hypothetical protein